MSLTSRDPKQPDGQRSAAQLLLCLTDRMPFEDVFGSLDGQVGLITGAGAEGGIGYAVATALTGMGASIHMTATSDRIHDRAAALGRGAVGHIADLTEPSAVESLVKTIIARTGRIDMLVNNAGMTSVAAGRDVSVAFERLTPMQWRETLDRNLTTAFLVSRACLDSMRAASYGRIVNVASTTGPVSAFANSAAYAAAKAGMVGMTRALAMETATSGITVNAVAPGWIDTPSAEDSERRAGKATPMQRSGRAAEVAAAIAFLCTPAASYITGALLVIDGANSVSEDHSHG